MNDQQCGDYDINEKGGVFSINAKGECYDDDGKRIGWMLPNSSQPQVTGVIPPQATGISVPSVQVPQPIKMPASSVWATTGVIPPPMSVLDLAKAIRECFAQTLGKIPCGPLDTIIEAFESEGAEVPHPPGAFEVALSLLDALYGHAAIDCPELKKQVEAFLKASGRLD